MFWTFFYPHNITFTTVTCGIDLSFHNTITEKIMPVCHWKVLKIGYLRSTILKLIYEAISAKATHDPRPKVFFNIIFTACATTRERYLNLKLLGFHKNCFIVFFKGLVSIWFWKRNRSIFETMINLNHQSTVRMPLAIKESMISKIIFK